MADEKNVTIVNCKRCAVRCRIGGPANPDARMLRFAKEGHGLCVNCAVHDFLRNCYPANMMMAKSGPAALLLEHVQEVFAGIMKAAMADATPPEIDWQLIVDNWDLPFADKVKPSATNPCSQQQLDAIASGDSPEYPTHSDAELTIINAKKRKRVNGVGGNE